jgi:transcriptional regulator with XRE-family HTH domain
MQASKMETTMADKIPFDASRIEAEENLLIDYQFLIQELMVAKGISRARLAALTGLSVARLSQIMSPEANPTVKTMARILHALGEAISLSVAVRGAVADTEPAKQPQWHCFDELELPASRQDTEMVAVVKRSLVSNDNDGRNVFVMEAA